METPIGTGFIHLFNQLKSYCPTIYGILSAIKAGEAPDKNKTQEQVAVGHDEASASNWNDLKLDNYDDHDEWDNLQLGGYAKGNAAAPRQAKQLNPDEISRFGKEIIYIVGMDWPGRVKILNSFLGKNLLPELLSNPLLRIYLTTSEETEYYAVKIHGVWQEIERQKIKLQLTECQALFFSCPNPGLRRRNLFVFPESLGDIATSKDTIKVKIMEDIACNSTKVVWNDEFQFCKDDIQTIERIHETGLKYGKIPVFNVLINVCRITNLGIDERDPEEDIEDALKKYRRLTFIENHKAGLINEYGRLSAQDQLQFFQWRFMETTNFCRNSFEEWQKKPGRIQSGHKNFQIEPEATEDSQFIPEIENLKKEWLQSKLFALRQQRMPFNQILIHEKSLAFKKQAQEKVNASFWKHWDIYFEMMLKQNPDLLPARKFQLRLFLALLGVYQVYYAFTRRTEKLLDGIINSVENELSLKWPQPELDRLYFQTLAVRYEVPIRGLWEETIGSAAEELKKVLELS